MTCIISLIGREQSSIYRPLILKQAIVLDRVNEFQETPEKDYGIILKLKNPYSPGDYFFICAGLGSYGNRGATQYFSRKWKELYKRFGSDEFLVVTETNQFGDTETRNFMERSRKNYK